MSSLCLNMHMYTNKKIFLALTCRACDLNTICTIVNMNEIPHCKKQEPSKLTFLIFLMSKDIAFLK